MLRPGADAPVFDHRRVALLHLAGQTRQEVAQMNASEIVSVQADTVLVRRQHTGTARRSGPADSRVVVEDRADANHAVRPVKDLACAGGADFAPVDTGKLRMTLRKEAFSRGHDRDGTAERVGELDRLLF